MNAQNKPDNREAVEQFTGWWIPADIVDIFQRGKINATDLVLLATIDSLVKRGRGRGLGCFASNAYLAEKIGSKNPGSVSNMISKLIKLKLLRAYGNNGRGRYLETKWSRIRP